MLTARAVKVDRLGNQLFTGATFTSHQHIGLTWRHLANQHIDLLHRCTLADHVGKAVALAELLTQGLILLPQGAAFKRTANDQADFIIAKGFGNIVESAKLHCLDRFFTGRKGGDHDHQRLGRFFPHKTKKLDAGDIRHLDIADDQIEVGFLQQRLSPGAVGSGFDIVPLALQHDGENFAQTRFVIDDENPSALSIVAHEEMTFPVRL